MAKCQYCGQKIKKGDRSVPQNSRYWPRNRVLAEDLGHTEDEMHNFAMKRCLFGKMTKVGPVEEWKNDSSADLNKAQFAKLMNWQDVLVIWLVSEQGSEIVLPGS